MQKENNKAKVNETLAFALAETNGVTLGEWQDALEVRTAYREQAEKLITYMEGVGLRVAVSRSKDMDKNLEHIRTWQPRPAYDLAEELGADPDVADPEDTPGVGTSEQREYEG